MALTPGTRLGVYEITAQIGEGGMGQVYRATDTKLKRQVAIKILPPSLASDADRLARLQREAEVLASLNHPNIAAIYGLEETGGITALVMELVEGDDLSQRISRGAIPLGEALTIAKQIAEALEAAHEQGIIHRDLKPANIKVRGDGTVKVLDFGLAKAMEPAAGSSPSVSMSPTLTTPAMTQAGMILGTAAYMSPEQAAGKPVDKRSDLWALGVVLMEMLTGRPLFTGETVSHVLAAVLTREPDWTTLPAQAPGPIRKLLRRCLEKDRKRRLADAADARLEIDEALSTPADGAAGVANPEPRTPSPVPRWRQTLPWAALAGVLGAALITALVLLAPWRSGSVSTPRKLLVSIGADASLPTGLGASAILSPDGTTLAFVGQQAGQTRLFLRKLDQLQAATLAGTEDADSPFFSPDGQWIAFFAGGKLKKIAVTGGAAVTLCDAQAGRGGTWTDDDTILFAPSSAVNTRLMRVSAAGGTPAVFGTSSTGTTTQRWPQALPGAKAVLYTEHSAGGNFDGATLVAALLSGGTPKVLVRGGYYGRYMPSGHLIYLHSGTLFAVRFDRDRLETVGQAVPVLDGVAANPDVTGGAQLAVSADGTLVYAPGTAATAGRPIDWLTRDGKTTVLRATKADWANPRFSPDGQKLAIDISDGKQRDIWVYEWARDTLTQLTFDPGDDRWPVWTPDGRRVVFASDRAKAGVYNLYWVNADGTGEVTRLTDSPDTQRPGSWHPSGRFLAFHVARAATGNDLMMLPMEGDATRGWTPGTPTVFLSTPAVESQSMFSPDGRFVAYTSNDASASTFDIYVRPFPGPGGKWRISTTSGAYPAWSATTHELLFANYLDPTPSKIMAAPYAVVRDSFQVETPKVWSPTSVQKVTTLNSAYDLHPDGKRIAATAVEDQGNTVQDKVVFVFNFAEYLAKIAPQKK